jgi:hypothetical protein
VTIELEDGTRYRLWLRPPLPKVGERLSVRVLDGDGGARKIERLR